MQPEKEKRREPDPKWKKAKPRRSGFTPSVVYKGRRVIILAAFALLLVPAIALAKGPIVRTAQSIWDFLIALL